MGLLGTGAVAIWHDIAPEGRAEFYAWHGKEHMPERVGIPGFRRGRRYIAVEGQGEIQGQDQSEDQGGADLEFFNLYEAETPAVVTGPDYKARLDNPTPWTVATVKHFRHVARSICRVALSQGGAQGGLAATWRYDLPAGTEAAHEKAMADTLLAGLIDDGRVSGVHLLVADRKASAAGNAESKARGVDNQVPGCVLMIEGWGDAADFAALCRERITGDALVAAGASGTARMGLYRLQITVSGDDIPGVAAG